MQKCPCSHCGQQIEFPDDMAGQECACPTCNLSTLLQLPDSPSVRIPSCAPRDPLMKQHNPTVDDSPMDPKVEDLNQSPAAMTAVKIIENVEKVIIGKREEITLAIVAFFSEGHILLEDVPGVAKTMLARSIAQSVGCSFKRVQCTPDLLPNDITGASVFNPKTTSFEFRPGPLFAQIVLVDEINRATPRTQSALLEAMAERQVTVDGKDYELQRPFLIIATQNPIDHEGTYPLPEAQLDRFFIRLSLGYPAANEEMLMIDRLQHRHPIEDLAPVVSATDVEAGQAAVRDVHVGEPVRDYVVRIVRATREHAAIGLGCSPRASIALVRAAQALACIRGDDFVLPDYVKEIAPSVLTHRLIVRPENRLRKVTGRAVVEEILREIPVPTISTRGRFS